MAENTYRISGGVVARKSRSGLQGLRVEAWDKDLVCDDFVGKAETGVDGVFHIEFSETYFRECFVDRRPDLYFKVYRAQTLLTSTEDSVTWNVDSDVTNILIEVDVEAPATGAGENARGWSVLAGLLSASPSLAQRGIPELYARLAAENGAPREVWKRLLGHKDLQQPAVQQELRFSLQLGALTLGNLALVQLLQEKRGTLGITSPADLPKFSEADWQSMLDTGARGGPIKAPAAIPGKDDHERAQAYARLLRRTVVAAFPNEALIGDLRRQSGQSGVSDGRKGAATLIGNLLRDNPVLDLRSTSIVAEARSRGGAAFAGIPRKDWPAALREATRIQNTFLLTPHVEEVDALLSTRLDSATSVARVPLNTFIRRMGPDGAGWTEVRARQVHASARQRASIANLIATTMYQGAMDVFPAAAGRQAAADTDITTLAEWADLFGSVEQCACEPCLSLNGPAAYLVALLQFLEDGVPNAQGKSPLEVLRARRPDIEYLKLTCENTQTLIPYIDLVNEILEAAVRGLPPSPNDTGDLQSEDLAAAPVYCRDDAYSPLAHAVYPFSLPYDRPLDQARVFLERLGTTRYELLSSVCTAEDRRTLAMACESLGLSARELQLLTEDPGPDLFRRYGFKDPMPPDWATQLTTVSEFLRRTGIEFTDLLSLLQTRYVNPDAAVQLRADPDCDLTKTTLTGPVGSTPGSAFARFHTFIRLWRKLGWSIADTDASISALARRDTAGRSILDDAFVVRLSDARRLREELDVSLQDALSLWTEVNTRGDDALYWTLFRGPAVRALTGDEFSLTNGDLKLLPDGSGLLDDHKLLAYTAVYSAALRLSEDDFNAIRIDAGLPANARLTLPNLSLLYRYGVLARGFGISVRDLIDWKTLIGIDPFQPASSAPTMVFTQRLRQLRQTGLTLDQLRYLYLSGDGVGHVLAPGLDETAAMLDVLVDKLQVVDTNAAQDSQKASIVATALAEKFGLDAPSLVRLITETLRSHVDPGQPAIHDFLRYGRCGLAATLFANSDATGVPEVERIDTQINFDWGGAAPAPGLNPSGFSVVWQGRLVPDVTSTRSLIIRTDGGLRFYVGDGRGAPSIDAWNNNQSIERSLLIDLVSGSPIPIRIEYRKQAGSSARGRVQFSWSTAPSQDVTIPQDDLGLLPEVVHLSVVTLHKLSLVARHFKLGPRELNFWLDRQANLSDGLLAVYCGTEALTGGTIARIDPRIDFKWDTGSPDPALASDFFSARWTGKLLVDRTGSYKFETSTDDGARLWIGKSLLIDDWNTHPARTSASETHLRAGELHDVRMEYFEQTGSASAKLSWSLAGGSGAGASGPGIAGVFSFALMLNSRGDYLGVFNRPDLLAVWAEVRDRMQSTENGLSILDAASTADAIPLLSAAGGISMEDATTLLAPFRMGWTATSLATRLQSLRWMLQCADLVKRTKVPAGALLAWSKDDPDQAQANAMLAALKSAYSASQWPAIAKPIHDGLRERGRDALVGYLVADQGYRNANELFEKYLIDVEMGACMTTSRVKQAISSVQLFVQHCLMNLERDVRPTSLDAKHWNGFLKNYRTWEANRKVFLYPENWLEPELRDDKSPFFEDLETALLQNRISDESVERAVHGYLDKLNQVARLDLRSLYWEATVHQPDGAQTNVLHVFARTFATPHAYFYRRLVDRAYWTPWERLQVDIEGDHLIPVVHHRRLYLFWPLFAEKAEAASGAGLKPDSDGNAQSPLKYWEIRLAWSESYQGKWSPKRVCEDAQTIRYPYDFKSIPSAETSLPRDTFWFQVDHSTDGLVISCLCSTAVKESGQEPKFIQGPKLAGRFELDDSCNQLYARQGEDSDSEAVVDARIPQLGIAQEWFMGFREVAVSRLTPDFQPPQTVLRAFQPAFIRYEMQPLHQANNPFAPWGLPPFIFKDLRHAYLSIPVSEEGPARSIITGALTDDVVGRKAIEDLADVLVATLVNAVAAPGGQSAADRALAVSGFMVPDPELQVMETDLDALPPPAGHPRLRFFSHFHPHVGSFVQALSRQGIAGLLSPANQRMGQNDDSFGNLYSPNPDVVFPVYPRDDVDFVDGAYSLYNWELFFHIPLFVATRLSAEQRFQEAQRWFHFIFDPTDTDRNDPSPQHYWRFLPFHEKTEYGRITDLLNALRPRPGETPAQHAERERIERQLARLEDDPFNAHAIARLRQVAYQKNVVMKYIDNLIAWGDSLFRRETMEAINEATLLYVLAAKMLGDRPQFVPAAGEVAPETFASLRAKGLDDTGNAAVAWGQAAPYVVLPPASGGGSGVAGMDLGKTRYFCVLPNQKLLSYWTTVADRLMKIRHCMNIEGRVRQLALFEPPIDPGLLQRARAAGLDLGQVLGGDANQPPYRFTFLIQKAIEFCGELKGLSGALLSAMEKRDAEGLSAIRSTQELALLREVQAVKDAQVREASEALLGLQKSREVVQTRYDFYKDIERVSAFEAAHLVLMYVANELQAASQAPQIAASILHALPKAEVGVSGVQASPRLSTQWGPPNIASALEAFGRVLGALSGYLSGVASVASTVGGYERRWQDWKLQERLARKELEQIDRQIAAAEIRRDISQHELDNHKRQIENARDIDTYMREKFTSQELYSWMVGQVASLFGQSYQLAFAMAQRAERAFRFERDPAGAFLCSGYWEDLRGALLAGDQLHHDLRRMESAYLERNQRELEITKHVSLLQHAPEALIALRTAGRCSVRLTEALFDADFPGQYMRRIKSVSLTIPCVAGPYTSVNCTLTMLSSTIRTSSDVGAQYAQTGVNDDRFRADHAAVESIVTSSAQNDSGMFELNFRDERYLPFEGAGAISEWLVELPMECNAIDFESISDVVIHMRYTARDGGLNLRNQALAELRPAVVWQTPQTRPLAASRKKRLFSLRHEFPSAWHAFLNPVDATSVQTLEVVISQDRVPMALRDSSIKSAVLYVRVSEAFRAVHARSAWTFDFGALTSSFPVLDTTDIGGLTLTQAVPGLFNASITSNYPRLGATWTLRGWLEAPPGSAKLRIEHDALEDLWLVVEFT